MRRIGSYLIPVLILLSAVPSGSHASTRHKMLARCPPRDSHVLIADPDAAVYTGSEPNGPLKPQGLFACVNGRAHSYTLGGLTSCESRGGIDCVHEELVDLNGYMVAYSETPNLEGPQQDAAGFEVVRDLRTGRIVHRVSTGTALDGPDGVALTDQILVSRTGAAAWTIESPFGAHSYQVRAVDKSGARLLASGPDIDPYSLAVAGSTVYWTQSGNPISAPLN